MSGFRFLAPEPLLLGASLGALLLLLVFFITERRQPRRWPRARALAGLVAVAALWLLAVQPASPRATATLAAVLFTDGTPPDVQLQEADRALPIFRLEAGEAATGPRATPLSDLAQLARQRPEIDRLRVYGNGLRGWAWQRTPAAVEGIEAVPMAAGIRQVDWPRTLTLGEAFTVRGVVAAVGEKSTLRLVGPGGVADTVELTGREPQPFVLRDRPRDVGRFVYALVRDGDEAAAGERLEVEVTPPRPLAILWLESAPRFETRHLKGWLAEMGSSLAVRSTLSRGRHRDEFHNRAAVALDRLTTELLAEFDLAVLDGSILAGLRPDETEALTAAVFAGGLGLLVVPPLEPLLEGEPLATSPLLAAPARPIEGLETLAVRAAWPGTAPAPPLTVDALALSPRRGLEPLVAAEADRALTGRRSHGAGFVGVSLLHDTYRWVLEGEAPAHRAYWSHVASALARPDPTAPTCQLPAGPVLIDQPLALVLTTSQGEPQILLFDEEEEGMPLALRQAASEGFRWQATVWPRQEGWHRLVLSGRSDLLSGTENGEPVCSFYAQPSSGWLAWQQQRRRDETRQRHLLGPAPDTSPTVTRLRPWPRLAPYLALLAALGFLWLGERLG